MQVTELAIDGFEKSWKSREKATAPFASSPCRPRPAASRYADHGKGNPTRRHRAEP